MSRCVDRKTSAAQFDAFPEWREESQGVETAPSLPGRLTFLSRSQTPRCPLGGWSCFPRCSARWWLHSCGRIGAVTRLDLVLAKTDGANMVAVPLPLTIMPPLKRKLINTKQLMGPYTHPKYNCVTATERCKEDHVKLLGSKLVKFWKQPYFQPSISHVDFISFFHSLLLSFSCLPSLFCHRQDFCKHQISKQAQSEY